MPVVDYEGRLTEFAIEAEEARAAVVVWIERRGTG
jgi:hypothetical protein